MLQPKLRRVLASAALVSALSLLPVNAALAQPRFQGNVAVRLASPFWNFLSSLLRKATIRIDPNGQRLAVSSDDPSVPEPGSPVGTR